MTRAAAECVACGQVKRILARGLCVGCWKGAKREGRLDEYPARIAPRRERVAKPTPTPRLKPVAVDDLDTVLRRMAAQRRDDDEVCPACLRGGRRLHNGLCVDCRPDNDLENETETEEQAVARLTRIAEVGGMAERAPGQLPGYFGVAPGLDLQAPWRTRAACKDEGPGAFYDNDREAEALAICDRCVVKAPCLEWALSNNERGVWGGLTEGERARRGSHAAEAAAGA